MVRFDEFSTSQFTPQDAGTAHLVFFHIYDIKISVPTNF